MPIALVQTAQNQANSTTVTATLGSNTTAGNCLVVTVAVGSNSSPAGTTVSSITLGGSAGNFSQLVADSSGASFIWADPSCAGGQTAVAVTVASGTQILVQVYEF